VDEEETLIFVDVDGVLNIGLRDDGNTPLLFSDSNVAAALRPRSKSAATSSEQQCLEKLFSVYNHQLDGEGATYGKLAASSSTQVSDELVGRLVKIIQAAGRGAKVVLSSTWRLPRHSTRANTLEEAIGRHLGCRFKFHSRTRICREICASDRLTVVGDYIADYVEQRPARQTGQIRVLVLEDFCISPMGCWACEGKRMDSCADVERYLEARAGRSCTVNAKLIHMYDEWQTDSGLTVHVGAGLTMRFLNEALDFLAKEEKTTVSTPPVAFAPPPRTMSDEADKAADVLIPAPKNTSGITKVEAVATDVCPIMGKSGLLGVFSQLLHLPASDQF
jgi:hypothetical protein